eukprot:CFRG6796T1
MTRYQSALISVGQLVKSLRSPSAASKLRILDCSWHMPATNRSPYKEFLDARIPGAGFLDIDVVADLSHSPPLPHMLPPAQLFERTMEKMGVSSTDEIVVYDTVGVAASARTWWALRAMGHNKVTVLNGGLPAWHAYSNGTMPYQTGKWDGRARPIHVYDDESERIVVNEDDEGDGKFKANFLPSLVRDKSEMLENCTSETPFRVADGRAPAGRFDGSVAEPREGIPNGHIPHSSCLPWTNLVHTDKNTGVTYLKDVDQLKYEFAKAGVVLSNTNGLTFSCGSGLTACVLALAAFECGKPDAAVYDGSWTDWALDPTTPKLSSKIL